MIADLYDFDKTVYPVDSATEFWMFCLKRHPKLILHLPHQIFAIIKFAFKKIDLTKFKGEFFCFLKSVDGEQEAELFWDKNAHKIFSWFKPKENDVKTVVCSASPEFEISPILKRLGAEVIIGTDMNPKTGEIRGKNCKGAEKVERIKKEAGGYVFRNAYTDNPKSDAPLLSLAENKFLIKDGEIIPL
ncbi:MAG: HAD-IB family phosphatase [Clostridia bacterium]|nr:HAD-IB family phosphatase [Clostridia bacterium]